MPGSIQVSVLDFKELPSSSNFVKLSLGKVEYEAGDKGTFSFPLTNLRDNLIITIQDSYGNQVSHSGFRTMLIIEKGTWEDLFPIEGGGLIHMKLQFILSDEERNRIRSMRESAMKKKQDEILGGRLRNSQSVKSLGSSLPRHEVSDVLRATSSQDFERNSFTNDAVKAGLLISDVDTSGTVAESGDWVNEELFQTQTSPNATDRTEETFSSPMTEGMHQKPLAEDTGVQEQLTDSAKKNQDTRSKPSDKLTEKLNKQHLEEKIPSDIKRTSIESTSTPLLQKTKLAQSKPSNNLAEKMLDKRLERLQDRVRQKAMVEDIKTWELTDLVKKNEAAKSNPSSNLAEKLDKQNLEEKIPSYVKKTSKESMPSSSQETKVNTVKNNETQLQQADVPGRSQEAASLDVGSSRSIIAEKIKSFPPKLAREPDKQGPPEKTPRNIQKMISVFESSISQDRVPLKPMKSYRVGTLRLKDHAIKDYSEKSEMSSSTRLGNSFSTGDLRKNLSSIIKKGERVASAGDELISADPEETQILPKESTTVASVGTYNEEKFVLKETNTKELLKSPEEGLNDEEKFALGETNTKGLPKSPEENATVSGRVHKDKKRSNAIHAETLSNKIRDIIHAQGDRVMSLLGDSMVVEEGHQEKTVSSIPESIVKGEVDCRTNGIVNQHGEMLHMPGNSSPKSSDEEGSTASLGQAIKVALVVGFGVLVLLFRQREPGKGKKKEDTHGLKTRVFMNKRGSIQDQRRKLDVLKLS